MNRVWKVVSAGALLAVALGPAALAGAQKASLDPAADPNYGTWTLSRYPDPLVLTLEAGGDVNASDANIGADCAGFVTSMPDMVLEHSGGPLRVFFAADGDTTLIVHQPDGTYVCNDDSVGTNPVIDISNAGAGNYAVWIGTFGSAGLQPGYMVVTSGESLPGALITPLLVGGGAAPAPNTSGTTGTTGATGTTTSAGDSLSPDSPATFGILPLGPGFQPDPTEVAMSAGGAVDIFMMNLGPECRGYVSAAPDVTVAYTSPGRFLRLFFQSEQDTTMVVRLPDGSFVCSDDFPNSLDPLVDISAPTAGTYNIWVGTFGSGQTADGTLVLTSGNTLDPINR